jgi:HEAT repeat protein
VALGKVPQAARERAAAKLLRLLDDPDEEVRIEAASGLGRIGDDSLALAVASHLQDASADVRRHVAVALGALGEPSVGPSLVVALSDPDESVVAAAAASLGHSRAKEATAALISVAKDAPRRAPARRAMESLLRLGTAESLGALVELLGSPSHRFSLGQALSDAGADALPVLKECVA